MADTNDLGGRIDAAFSAMEAKRQQFQAEETKKHLEWQSRLEKIGNVFESLRSVWTPRLETLIKKFGDKVAATPTLSPSTREVVLNFQSDVARIRLRFRATSDSDITKIILSYDLDITPILMKFDSHSELEMPLDAVSHDAVGKWIDECIVSFVNTYVSVHEHQFYLKEQMVQDPVSGTRFPKLAAGATLQRDGQTHYFISEETKREFEKKSPGLAKS